MDILIRDIPDDVIAGIDAAARRLGISRAEYVRRRLGAMVDSDRQVTIGDLEWFAKVFADLADADVMRRAWE